MKSFDSTRLALVLSSLLLALGLPLNSLATGRYSREQLALLPPYCADSELAHDYVRFGPRWKYWTALIGENFNRIHHYCQGMLHVMEARRLPPRSQAQTIALKRAIDEYNFILSINDARVMRQFPLWPEMLARRGEAATMLEDWALAVQSYELARTVKPDYWPAYLAWAEVLVRLKLTDRARELLKQGLLIDPTVESMRAAYAKLGGSLDSLPPKTPKSADEPASSSSSASEPAGAQAASSASH